MCARAPINFYTVWRPPASAARVPSATACAGYSLDKARAYGVVVNPNKAEPVTFAADDMVIVLAEG
jgi:hypothetical protein